MFFVSLSTFRKRLVEREIVKKCNFYVKKFGGFDKTAYLCNRKNKEALLAQLVEQLTLNQWVQGSNP